MTYLQIHFLQCTDVNSLSNVMELPNFQTLEESLDYLAVISQPIATCRLMD